MALLLSELGTIVGGLIIAMIYSWNLTLIVIFPILTLAVAIIIGQKVLLLCSGIKYNVHALLQLLSSTTKFCLCALDASIHCNCRY